MRAVLAGLSGLDSVAQDKKYRRLMEKFSPRTSAAFEQQHIAIDLSSHYKSSLAPKIGALQGAIDTSHTVTFTYCSRSGERQVLLDPYLVVFHWESWYAFGRDCESDDFRLFKLNRLWALEITQQSFVPQQIPSAALSFDNCFTDEIQVVVLFSPGVKYRLVDEYGIDSFTVLSDGRLRFSCSFTNEDYLLEWLLGFGENAELIQPQALRAQLCDRLQKALGRYERKR